MDKKGIIACLDTREGKLIKGKKFKSLKDLGDPVERAAKYASTSLDELVFYDIFASKEKRGIFLDLFSEISDKVKIPLTAGGGVKSLEDIEKLLEKGASKVSINTAAVENPQLIEEAAKKFGKDRIMVAIDGIKTGENKWKVKIYSNEKDPDLDLIEWAEEIENLGAGSICMNSIDQDGVREGYDLDLIRALKDTVSIPIIASGGAGKKEDFLDAFKAGADYCLAASVFHYDILDIDQLKKYLQDQGIDFFRRA